MAEHAAQTTEDNLWAWQEILNPNKHVGLALRIRSVV